MTKSEFLTRQHAAKRQETIWGVVWFVAFFAVLIGNLPLAKSMDRSKPAEWIKAVYICGFFGFMFGNLVLVAWFTRHRARKFGLLCPSCEKPLTQVAGRIAIASGNCCYCGGRVFEDDKSGSDE